MICECGWKYKDELRCPRCGKANSYKTGVGMPNHDGHDLARMLYGKKRKAVKPVSDRRRKRLETTGGERRLFETIWRLRKHVCQNKDCKCKLQSEARAHYFAHIHSKGARPDLRTDPRNVVLLCPDCEHESQRNGWKSINLPEPYKTMRDQPPKFQSQ